MSYIVDMDAPFSQHTKYVYWLQEKNGSIRPEDIKCKHQSCKFWFKCSTCNHDFDCKVRSVSVGAWCGFCGNKRLCESETCDSCFKKSFASSERAVYWSSKNAVTPRSVFKGCNDKFLFNCPCGLELSITLNNITSLNRWCRKCGRDRTTEKQSLKLEEFISRSTEMHGDRYDYSEVVMNGVDRNVIIICKTHGKFNQTPWKHYADGHGCHICAEISRTLNRRNTFEEFIEMVHKVHEEGLYDYSKAKGVYLHMNHPIPIICKVHGEFTQLPEVHSRGNGCPKCGTERTSEKLSHTNEDFIELSKKIHGHNTYLYPRTEYKNMTTRVILTCQLHGDFEQLPLNHLRGCGCPNCINKTAGRLTQYLQKSFDVTPELRPKWCPSPRGFFRYDFYIKDLELIVELDGLHHFRRVANWNNSGDPVMKRDVYKMRCANRNGIRVIRLLQQDVWDNDESWLDTNLKPLLVKKDAHENEYIGDMYDEHKRLMAEGTEIDPSEFYDEEE